MDDKVALGSVGFLDLSFSGGKACLTVQAAADGGTVAANVAVTCDAGMLIDQLEAVVAKAVPATAAIDPAIFAVIKQAVMAIA